MWEKVERVQLEAARVVSGALRSAPRESVLVEAGLCAVKRVAEGLWMAEMEKCLRASENSPRRVWGLRVVRKRLVRNGWRECAKRLLGELLPEGVVRQRMVFGEPPWNEWKGVCWDVDGTKSEHVEKNREEALERLEKCGVVDVCVYTDGSAVGGVRRGGAGMVVTNGDVREPEVIAESARAAGMVTSSYQAEMYALLEGLLWLKENGELWQRALVVSDSQSGLVALKEARGGRCEELLSQIVGVGKELSRNNKELVFVWVPGHCGLPGNEMADVAAKRGTSEDQSESACMYKSVRCLWKSRERVMEWQHQRCKEVYGEGVRTNEECDWTREDAVSMARLRSGHSLELRSYRCRIGLDTSGVCRRCGEEDETVEHVVKCAAGWMERLRYGINSLSDLCCRPREALKYWRWWRRAKLEGT